MNALGIKPTVIEIAPADIRIDAKFAKLNKNNRLAEYQSEVDKGEYRNERCKITHIATMTTEQYDFFINNLLTDFDWLVGLGGTYSDMPDLPDAPWYEWPQDAIDRFKRNSYRLVVAICAPERDTFYVDPQGYRYARYVGM